MDLDSTAVSDTYSTRSVAVPSDYLSYERSIRHREKHIDIVAVIMIVLGALEVLFGLASSGILVFAGLESGQSDPALRVVFPVMAVCILLVSLAMAIWLFLTGWGLHRRTKSARISTYVLGGLFCLNPMLIPVGIYALWTVAGEIANMAFGSFAQRLAPPVAKVERPDPAARQPTPLPPDPRNRRAGSRSYPRPPVGVPTPPAGVARPCAGPQRDQPSGEACQPPATSPAPAGHLDSLATVKDMPSPFRPSGPEGH